MEEARPHDKQSLYFPKPFEKEEITYRTILKPFALMM